MYAEHTELNHHLLSQGIAEAIGYIPEPKYQSVGEWEEANGKRFLDHVEGN